MNTDTQINIFIVDDNKIFSLALKADIENAFVSLPILIHLFETGEKCMEKFIEIRPQVVILDYNLNHKYPQAADGIKVLEWIKQENKETNVIMLTNDDNIEIALKSFHQGASDYVVKSETQFKKINYSLLNLFKMMEANNYAKRYKHLIVAISICVSLLAGAVIAIQVFNHTS